MTRLLVLIVLFVGSVIAALWAQAAVELDLPYVAPFAVFVLLGSIALAVRIDDRGTP